VIGEAKDSTRPAEKSVGYQVIRSPPAIRLPSAKMALRRTASLWLARRPHIQANALRSVVGVKLWGALWARYWLAVPEAELKAKYAVSRLPMEILELDWYPLLHARYRFSEHIMGYEAWASVIPLEMMAATEGCHGWEISSLMDNEPWSGAAAKDRSPSPQPGPMLRRKAALQAAARVECHLPWTNTHHQPADFYSRIL